MPTRLEWQQSGNRKGLANVGRVRVIEAGTADRSDGDLSSAISTAMVRLQKEFGGIGPEKTKTHWAGDDMVVVLMRGGYTAAEGTMHQGGQGLAVRDARHSFQDVMAESTKQIIRGLTGREVTALMTASHQSPDLTTLIFVLAPTEPDSPAAEQA